MRADRLIRKSYLKKSAVRPDGEITLYDLSDEPVMLQEDPELVVFYEIEIKEETDCSLIAAMPYAFETQRDILSWCGTLMAQSPAACALWEDAQAEGWSVGISDLQSAGFHLDVSNKEILLDHFSLTASALGRSAYFRNTLLLTFIRALRDIWHETRLMPFEDEYAPEDVLMLERVREADCDTLTVQAVWELRCAGYAETWRHLIGSAEGDLALIFTKFLEHDPSALFDGSALTYVFRQWYADQSRVDGCDHESLEALDVLLLDEDGDEAHSFGRKKLKAETLESLSILPDGTCYLAGLGDIIYRDPFFAGLRDEINQTHLFQLIYDTKVTMVNNVPFRDKDLARRFFPQNEIHKSE